MRGFALILLILLTLTACTAEDYAVTHTTAEEIRQLSLKDFTPDFLTAKTPSSEYKLLEGTGEELTVTVVQGAAAGPAIYIVGGLHGDEQAGWLAGELLCGMGIEAGTVYILAPANTYGAEHNQRKTAEGWDLNRAFPGEEGSGIDARRIANAIYEDIQDKQPCLVLDLHEANPHEGERDSLGNSVICLDLEGIDGLILDILLATEAGELCNQPFTIFNSPPVGSINRLCREGLGIPAITVETDRTEALWQRVDNHLAIADYILRYYSICE